MTAVTIPDDLKSYDVERWYNAGRAPAYFAAQVDAGVDLRTAYELRSDANVADVREARRRRMAYGAQAAEW